MAGNLSSEGLEGGYRYGDAQTDDARLVIRVLREAVAAGATAINYVRVDELLRDGEGLVTGVRLRDMETNRHANLETPLVINATGAWADQLRREVGSEPKIRPLRGSHLIFPRWRLPLSQAVSFLHPIDGRPVFLFPWQGVTLVGTTDVDYDSDLDGEPGITAAEVAYLMAAVEARYPMLGIKLDDVISTFAGVRPVIGSGKENPSEESRDHVIWEENGLLTVTGGKLTTFRLVALEVLSRARQLTEVPDINHHMRVLDEVDTQTVNDIGLDEKTSRRLLGWYATDVPDLLAAAQKEEMEKIPDTDFLWAELRWAARAEGVVHLDDLLLRRVRIGLLAKQGAKAHLSRIRTICQEELGWDDSKWEAEVSAYSYLWDCCYSLPPRSTIPDWRRQLEDAQNEPQVVAVAEEQRSKYPQNWGIAAFLAALIILLAILFVRKRDGSGRAAPGPLVTGA
jgi:glycerol-3-phosphate dehydrogenase